jgi:hypothetical protein
MNFDAGVYHFTLRADDGVRFYVDGYKLIDEWHTATSNAYSADVNLAAGTHTLTIEYFEEIGAANIWFTYQAAGNITAWQGNYFANDQWSGQPTLIRNDDHLDFDWQTGSPDRLIPVDHFSVRWTRSLDLAAGNYTFDIIVDDGARFYVDGIPVIDEVHTADKAHYAVTLALMQGRHDFRIDYVEYTGLARFTWTRISPIAPTLTVTSTPTVTRTATPTPTATTTSTPTPTSS